MITDDQLTGMRTMHAGFRTEFGRLAQACRSPRNARHEELLEEHVALVLDVLHKHHHHEDEHLWPFLVSQAPESKGELDALEAEHEVLDPLMTAAGDPARSWAERADAMTGLHDFLNIHLDHEEATAFPLMRRFMTPEMVESDRRKAIADMGRRPLPRIFGWIASCCHDDLLALSLAEHPRILRVLFRLFWWPAHQRRMLAMYGPDVSVPNSLPFDRTAAPAYAS